MAKSLTSKRMSTKSAGQFRPASNMSTASGTYHQVWPRANTQSMKTLKKKEPVYMTFKELREKQRIAERANVGPGSTEYLKPFGSDVKHRMHFGARPQKYKNMFYCESNPQVGPGSTEYLQPFGKNVQHNVFFAGKQKKKRAEITPSPGAYQPS